MKKISLSLIILFFFFSLFFMPQIAEADVELFLTSPTPYDATNNPAVYKPGGNITLQGSNTAVGCGNQHPGLILNFYIETISGSTKSFTLFATISTTSTTSFGPTTATLPSNTYVGMNNLMVTYDSEFVAVWIKPVYSTEIIRVSATPTTPSVSICPTSPTASSDLNCIVTAPSKVIDSSSNPADPYNFCSDPYNCPPYNVSPIYYTYKWYKNSSLYSTITDSTSSSSTLTNPPEGNWYCTATPLSRAGWLIKQKWPSGQTSGSPQDWTTMQGATSSQSATVTKPSS